MKTEKYNPNKPFYSVREALRLAFRQARIAQESGNNELRWKCHRFIRKYYSKRNQNNLTIMNVG